MLIWVSVPSLSAYADHRLAISKAPVKILSKAYNKLNSGAQLVFFKWGRGGGGHTVSNRGYNGFYGQDIVTESSPPEYCRLFAYKKAHKERGAPQEPPPLATPW